MKFLLVLVTLMASVNTYASNDDETFHIDEKHFAHKRKPSVNLPASQPVESVLGGWKNDYSAVENGINKNKGEGLPYTEYKKNEKAD